MLATLRRLSLALMFVTNITSGIRVLQTNPNVDLPPRSAQAELLDSSLREAIKVENTK